MNGPNLITSTLRNFVTALKRTRFRNSADYWERRYIRGGNSGAGSYNRLAQFKADIVNGFVADNNINSVVEFGSGDGAQLELAKYPAYVGIDVSPAAVAETRRRFNNDGSKVFYLISEVPADLSADLSLSLDVIYHLVEDETFDAHMRALFDVAARFVIIYSSNCDAPRVDAHVRHRQFTVWVEKNRPDFGLIKHVPNAFPFDERNPDNSSFADFYIFERAQPR
jgi:hypothetical protein